MNNDLLTIQEAADILRVSTKTLRRWDAKGILVPQRTTGNQRRYDREQIESFRAKREGVSESSLVVAEASKVETYTDLSVNSSKLNYKQKLIFSSFASVLVVFLVLNVFAKTNVGEMIDGVINSLGSYPGEEKEFSRNQGESVLGEATSRNSLSFNVNIPSEFNDSASFIEGLSATSIATLSGGIITENQDIDAGTGTVTASNLLYGVVAGSGITITGDTQKPQDPNEGVVPPNKH